MNDSYCYDNSEVLINRLNITDPAKFKIADRKFTMLRIMDLIQNPLSGSFDANHLCKIHKYIFQDLYSWAGKYRTVEIAKGLFFCKSDYIDNMLTKIFKELKSENYLKNCSHADLPVRLAYYLGEINAIHPFREGNGRTQREFIRELALTNGATVYFSKATKKDMITASINSFRGDYTAMEILMRKITQFK